MSHICTTKSCTSTCHAFNSEYMHVSMLPHPLLFGGTLSERYVQLHGINHKGQERLNYEKRNEKKIKI